MYWVKHLEVSDSGQLELTFEYFEIIGILVRRKTRIAYSEEEFLKWYEQNKLI